MCVKILETYAIMPFFHGITRALAAPHDIGSSFYWSLMAESIDVLHVVKKNASVPRTQTVESDISMVSLAMSNEANLDELDL